MKLAIITTLAISLAAIASGCTCVKNQSNINVTIREITLSKISFDQSTIDVAVRIYNENPANATLDRIEYDIYFGNKDKWIWIGRGEKEKLDIAANETSDFTVTTIIENQQYLKLMTNSIFGTSPTQMKVDGTAWCKVGPATFEVAFDETDINPYDQLSEGESIGTEPVEAGTEGERGE